MATHMHTLRPHILADQLRSHSTCPCGGRRCPSHCMAVQSAEHSSYSSHTRPGRSSPPGHNKVFLDTYMAIDRTAASQLQLGHI